MKYKKGFTNPQILGAIILIIVCLYLFTDFRIKVQEGSLLSNFATSHETTNTIVNEKTTYVTEKVNLCNLLAVYLIPADIDAQCIANGGTWTCNSVFVGCSNLPLPIIDCTGPAITSSTYQCQTVGGTAVCNPTNIYCSY